MQESVGLWKNIHHGYRSVQTDILHIGCIYRCLDTYIDRLARPVPNFGKYCTGNTQKSLCAVITPLTAHKDSGRGFRRCWQVPGAFRHRHFSQRHPHFSDWEPGFLALRPLAPSPPHLFLTPIFPTEIALSACAALQISFCVLVRGQKTRPFLLRLNLVPELHAFYRLTTQASHVLHPLTVYATSILHV